MSIFDNFKNINGAIVDTGWAKWLHTQVPDEPEDERNKIRKMLSLLKHCLPCTALSGCYFAKHKFPGDITKSGDGMLHEHCHCYVENKSLSLIKGEMKAYCDITKFTNYIFNEEKSKGKTDLFNRLEYFIEDSEYLKEEYEKQARIKYANSDYELNTLNEFGQNIRINIELVNRSGRHIVFVSAWKVHPKGYITCNTPYADR